MKLWLLQPIWPAVELWWPEYDSNHGFVVQAESEQAARELANAVSGDEHRAYVTENGYRKVKDYMPYLNPAYTTCIELTGDGPERIILRDFNAG
jgi:hypothetical protein